MSQEYKTVALDRIIDPERPLRSDLSPESVEDLAASIKRVGIIEPLIVRKQGDDFEIIAGHRRLLAADLAGLTMAPCIIVDVDEIKAEVMKLHENLAREEISAIDWANHLTYLKQQYQLDTAKLAELVGMSEAWIQQHLAILNYPDYLKTALTTGALSFTSARELSAIKDDRKRQQYVEYAVKGGVTPNLAAQWRREANLDTLTQQQPPTANPTLPTPEPVVATVMICPVCGKAVPLEEAKTLTIHSRCSPN